MAPSPSPTRAITDAPSATPTGPPTDAPTLQPSATPTNTPTCQDVRPYAFCVDPIALIE